MRYSLKRSNRSVRLTLDQFRLALEQSDDTTFGVLLDGKGHLVSSAFGHESEKVRIHLEAHSKKLGVGSAVRDHPLTHAMVSLFHGKEVKQSPVLNTRYISGFQQKVYSVLNRIPVGKVTTYGLISKHLGSAPRAVGGAVGSNPWPLFVPCQRVVNFDLSVGNYGLCGSLGPEGTVTKRSLLEREKVPIVGGQIGRTAVWDPSRNGR